ncbi:hypothetical protein ATKI12_6415 [Kitasatospora sp. Ki12]|uniref:hypothetical protein n=1 Tax=Kitasatospora xanthocidica TaxID=83382 RepID=UPI001674C4F4|nr:hypothetical protein [Kitasatospora xanthocidica]GHF66988.1 hypothetical protein GCM10018790_51150 [Kitasatospora xanthocidica]
MNEISERSRRLVLRDGVDESAVEELATLIGWPRRTDIPADHEEWTPRQVAWYAGPAIALTYSEDLLSGFSYVMITGSDERVIRSTVELAETELNTWRLSELVQGVDPDADPGDYATAVLRLGLGSPSEFDEEFFRIISQALRSHWPEVRKNAVWAITYEPWPAYATPLGELLQEEKDEELADTARIVLEEMTAT